MKLNKKFSGIILMLALGGALVGCGNGQQKEEPKKETVETVDIATKENQDEEVEKEEAALEEPKEEIEEVEEEIQVEEQKEEVTQEEVQQEDVEKKEEKPATKPENKPETQPEKKPESKPEEKPVTKPESVPEVKPEVKPEEKPEVKPEEKPDVQPEVTTLTAREVLGKITADLEMPAHMDMDEFTFADTYGIDPSILESYQVKMPMLVVHASEIAVFQLKDAKDTQQVIDGINRRQQSVRSIWETYLPEQFELVNNYKVVQKGNYILFAIEAMAETIVNNFNSTVQ